MKTLMLAILIGTIPAWGQVPAPPAPPAAPAAAAMPTLDKVESLGLDLANTRLQLLATQFKNAQMQEALVKADSEKIQADFQALSNETQKSITGLFVKYKVDQSKFDFSLETKTFLAKKLLEGQK